MHGQRPKHDHPWNLPQRLCQYCGKHLMSSKNRINWTCTQCRHSYYQPQAEKLRQATLEQEFLRELERRR